MKTVDLSKYRNKQYRPGNQAVRIIWCLVSILFFKTSIPWYQPLKQQLLKMFGAKIGTGVVVKPSLNIKYPWFLKVGEHTWIGENVWIDNLINVEIGNHVCISQGACIFTGNHNYKKETFDLMLQPVTVQDGVWIGAKAVICPGVVLATHSVVAAGSVVTKNTEPYIVYRGNPATAARKREIL